MVKLFDENTPKTAPETPVDWSAEIELARQTYTNDDVEIDADPATSAGDLGVWVAAWVWVEFVENDEDDPPKKPLSETLKGNVSLAPMGREILGGRCGTVHTSLDAFQARFGPPTIDYGPDDSDGKVTKTWHFDTPRGPIEVRDYWWNGPQELSMGSTSFRAALWLAGCLRRVGIAAHCGN